ncbi:hypothetical protein ACS0TY_017559 [Phlomoides rotata]
MLSWYLWKARNLLIFERKCLTEMEVVQHALRLLHEFQDAAYNRVTRDKPKAHRTYWCPPPAGTLKLNSDAAVFADGTAGFGFVIRDAYGLVTLAGTKRCRARGNSTLVEALALRYGIQQALTSGLSSFQIETDSEILAMAIRGKGVHADYIMMLVEDIRSLAKQVNCRAVLFCKREANNVAHSLAQYGAFIQLEKLWSDNVPTSCFRFLINDVRREPTNV